MDIDILLALQQFREGAGSFLTEFFAKMTFFGELPTVIVIMAVVYWCVSKEFGSYLLMGWSGNRLVNGFLKVTACAYRPWIRDARIVPYGNAMTTATGYSFPSGHTMNASTVYGGCAVRKDLAKGFRIVMGLLIVLIGLSRCWLGVHTPQDILVGWVCGIPVMWLTAKLMRWIEAHPEKDLLVVCIGIVLAAAVAVYAGVKSYPVDYNAEGKVLVDGAKMANDTFKGVGWCLAFLVGWILERRFVGFSTDVSSQRKLMRLGSGLLGYYAVSLILVPLVKNWIGGPAGTLISCFLQIFYIAFLFPWIFKHFEKEK
ncbi:MAG: phosphatase PAP2 family protein [Anaerolineaceae bacterium]|nr:phosphatase PAP2 family protein [Anaerolineaceae bacterium]